MIEKREKKLGLLSFNTKSNTLDIIKLVCIGENPTHTNT